MLNQKIIMMKKLFTLLALVAISFSSMAQWLPQASGFTEASRGIKYMHAVSDQIVWATAYDGAVTTNYIAEFTKTTNGGDLWTPGVINNAVGLEPGMICAIDENTAYVPLFRQAGALPQGIYVTTDGGATWNQQTTAAFSNAASFPNVVHFFDANNGFCQGDPINGDFELYTTTDGGTTWTLVPVDNIPAPASGEWGVVGYYSAIGDNIWFGTNKGRVYYSTDKGLNWGVTATTLTNKYVDVKFADALHGIAMDKSAATTGAMSETFDGGLTWTAITATGTVLTNDYAFVPGTANTWVCTGAAEGLSGIAYSYDGGHSWTFFPDTEGTQFLATDWIDNSTGWCGAFNESSTVGGMWKFNGTLEAPLPPVDLEATVVDGNNVTLTWTAPAGTRALLGYNVWRNNAVIASGITETQYEDLDLGNGTYVYLVTAVYDAGESTPAGPVEVTITGVSTNDLPLAQSLKVYPSPATDYLNINAAAEITNARLINVSGKVVYESNGNSNEMRISTSGIPAGLYLLNLTTKEGNITRKVSIR